MILGAGLPLWLITEASAWTIHGANEFLTTELRDRDRRWVLREREGSDPGRRSGDWNRVVACTRVNHLVSGNTCDKELKAARGRTLIDRWLLRGTHERHWPALYAWRPMHTYLPDVVSLRPAQDDSPGKDVPPLP